MYSPFLLIWGLVRRLALTIIKTISWMGRAVRAWPRIIPRTIHNAIVGLWVLVVGGWLVMRGKEVPKGMLKRLTKELKTKPPEVPEPFTY